MTAFMPLSERSRKHLLRQHPTIAKYFPEKKAQVNSQEEECCFPLSEHLHSCNFSDVPRVVFPVKCTRKSWSPWGVEGWWCLCVWSWWDCVLLCIWPMAGYGNEVMRPTRSFWTLTKYLALLDYTLHCSYFCLTCSGMLVIMPVWDNISDLSIIIIF